MNKTPETTFDLVQKWMKKAAENCRAQGKSESAMLWSDALQHLEYQQSRIAGLEQQVAELSKDKARLDWLQEKKVLLSCREEHTGLEGKYICEVAVPNDASDVNMGIDTCYLNADLRKAIDAAIAKEQEHE